MVAPLGGSCMKSASHCYCSRPFWLLGAAVSIYPSHVPLVVQPFLNLVVRFIGFVRFGGTSSNLRWVSKPSACSAPTSMRAWIRVLLSLTALCSSTKRLSFAHLLPDRQIVIGLAVAFDCTSQVLLCDVLPNEAVRNASQTHSESVPDRRFLASSLGPGRTEPQSTRAAAPRHHGPLRWAPDP